MIADIFRKCAGIQLIKLTLKKIRTLTLLLKFRLQRTILGLKIRTRFFYMRILILEDSKSLLEDRRRAMLVDEFFEKLKHD